jgi:hypothetical protein
MHIYIGRGEFNLSSIRTKYEEKYSELWTMFNPKNSDKTFKNLASKSNQRGWPFIYLFFDLSKTGRSLADCLILT